LEMDVQCETEAVLSDYPHASSELDTETKWRASSPGIREKLERD
jgi:hypothetical protein